MDVSADYYTQAECDGGYDAVVLPIPPSLAAVSFEVSLNYQTTSREYIEFLRDEINANPSNITLPTTPFVQGEPDPSSYIIQNDPFFSQLKARGDTIWELWTHNMNVDGAARFLMAQATVGGGGLCGAPVPNLLPATAGCQQVSLAWDNMNSSEPLVTGYGVYYDQSGKAQPVASLGLTTNYDHLGLTNGQEYCYKLTSLYSDCESVFSEILCATPQNQGQMGQAIGAASLDAGIWTGKGANKVFQVCSLADCSIAPGDTVVIRAYVAADDSPVSNATVEITIGGPETVTLNSNPSGADGYAYATWQTQKPNRKGQGGATTGTYTASVTNVTASGYSWDGTTTSTQFKIQ